MGQIQESPKTKMTNSEFQNFCYLLIQFITDSKMPVISFKSTLDILVSAYGDYYNSMFKISMKSYVSRSGVLKKELNSSRVGLFSHIKGDITSRVAEVKAAGQELYSLFKSEKYKGMSTMKLEDLKAYTSFLIDDLNSDHYKPLIKKLNYEIRVSELEEILKELNDLKLLVISESGKQKRLRKTVNARKDLNIAYENFRRKVNALIVIDGDDPYMDLMLFWNSLIDNYRVQLSNRLGKGKGGKTSSENQSKNDPTHGTDNKPNGGDGSGGDSGSGDDTGGDSGSGGEDDRPVIE